MRSNQAYEARQAERQAAFAKSLEVYKARRRGELKAKRASQALSLEASKACGVLKLGLQSGKAYERIEHEVLKVFEVNLTERKTTKAEREAGELRDYLPTAQMAPVHHKRRGQLVSQLDLATEGLARSSQAAETKRLRAKPAYPVGFVDKILGYLPSKD